MTSLNFETARHNMVAQQIRTWEVTDAQVLELVARAPREDYVPARLRNLAFVDMNLPLGHGQVMMAPKLEARLLQTLALHPGDKVLEIGTGSGYVTSLLAALAGRVISVEIFPEFSAAAARRLEAHGHRNVTLEVGDAAAGWDRHGPYDAILVTGSLPVLPEAFRQGLAPGGRLLAIVGESPAMAVRLVRRLDQHGFGETSLFETDLPPLINARAHARFVF